MVNTQKKIFLLIFLSQEIFLAQAQTQSTSVEMNNGYYIVVGAFLVKNNARNYVSYILKKRGVHSTLGYSYSGRIYYVYTNICLERTDCLTELNNLRKEIGFEDTWIKAIKPEDYVGPKENDSIVKKENKDDLLIPKPESQTITSDP